MVKTSIIILIRIQLFIDVNFSEDSTVFKDRVTVRG